MNLVQARQFVAFDQSPIKENVPKQLASRYKMCLRVFRCARELSPTEKIGLLEALRSKIALNNEHDPLMKKVQAAIASVQANRQRIESRVSIQIQKHRARLEEKHGSFVDYAILDSLPELPGSTEGLSENLVTQFFLNQLEHFNRSSPSMEVNRLIHSLENLFELNLYIYDQWYDCKDGLRCPMRYFKSKVLNLLNQMSDGRLPYIFLPCCSEDHAMVGKLDWFERRGYRFTIINTGGGVPMRQGNKAFDAVYSDLTQTDVMNVTRALLVVSANSAGVYAKIAQALPLKNCTYFNSRKHSMQKRDSCAVKSLTASMHSVLPEKIYWPFKVFYTERLIGEMAKGPKYDAACQILEKRTKKSLSIRNV
jgi:hypothetical protein